MHRFPGAAGYFICLDADGLDPAIAQRLFKPFTSTQPISRGREVGLSVCKSIVENHGGSIEAAAAGTRGARFTVTLPAIAAV